VHALAALTEFAARWRGLQARGKRVMKRALARQALALPRGAQTLAEHRAKNALRSYGIPVVREALMSPAEIAALKAPPFAFPVAVKIASPDVPHKTEAGAVRLGIPNLTAMKQAVRDILASVRSFKADARIDGVLVQEMASGLEVIVGAVNDPCFGPAVAFGMGGVLAELLKDVTHRFAPFEAETAREMIAEIKGAALLNGYRGGPALDVGALADVLSRVSLLIADHADRIAEIDINPLFVREAGKGVVAADALIVLRQS